MSGLLMRYCAVNALLLLLIFPLQLLAIETVSLQGLFGNKVVLAIDGKNRVLAEGEITPEGVKVILVDARGAILEVAGEQKRYALNTSISYNFIRPETRSEKIYKDSGGMYHTIGSINGFPVTFLIDTGASFIAMNKNQAKRLGIRYRETGKLSGVSTASGYEKAYRVKLKTVSVGNITQKNVEAMVIEGNHPGPVLLGMSFLGRLSVEHSGNAMTLKQRK